MTPGRGEPILCDEALFERLRRLRRTLADSRHVPPYIVFSDVSLRQMARDLPRDESSFLRISGVGEKKLREFGDRFLAEITSYLLSQRQSRVADDHNEAQHQVSEERGV